MAVNIAFALGMICGLILTVSVFACSSGNDGDK